VLTWWANPALARRCANAFWLLPGDDEDQEDVVEFFETLENRHSVRSFSGEEIPHETIERVLAAAATAPSSLNEQPWHFYVATGAAREQVGEIMAQSTAYLEEFIEVLGPDRYEHALQWYNDLGSAPVILACTTIKAENEFQEMNRLVAVGAAIQNVLLAATAEGLGACNITFAFMVKDEIEKALGVSEERSLVSIIALGYPSDELPASPPKNPDVADYVG
jgi:nitroreductase